MIQPCSKVQNICMHACVRKEDDMMMMRGDASLYCLCLLNCHSLKFRWNLTDNGNLAFLQYFVELVKVKVIYSEVIYFYSHRTRPTGCDSRALLQKTDAPCVAPVHAWTWESSHLCVKKIFMKLYDFLWIFKEQNVEFYRIFNPFPYFALTSWTK